MQDVNVLAMLLLSVEMVAATLVKTHLIAHKTAMEAVQMDSFLTALKAITIAVQSHGLVMVLKIVKTKHMDAT